MSIFSKGKEVEAVLFSPLEGKITFDGQPAAGAEIRLWVAWKDKEGVTEVIKADKQGFFRIPKKVAKYADNPLVQIVITQEITVIYNGESYLIWTLSRTSTNEYGELGGKPINFTCELTDEIEGTRSDSALFGTSCKWELLNAKAGLENE